ncbi:MAG: shikimate kinase [Ruminococcus sp.]|jgi:shikimate kinase|nr:shikimate kinase [Ruminococcus sp.]
MYTIFISGFMACGKTTVGRKLASQIECDFYDLDEYISHKLGATIPEIFAEHGEEYFRSAEAFCLKELCSKGGIVACGGGTMADGKNYGTVKLSGGFVIYIDTPFELCIKRIRRDGEDLRPVAKGKTDEELSDLYNTRKPLYLKNCDAAVSGLNPSLLVAVDVIDRIADLIDIKTDEDVTAVNADTAEKETGE